MSDKEINVLKTATTSSLSARSILTYEVGGKDSAVFLRITQNSGSGIYSKSWIELSQITPDDTPITAKKLKEIFKGKSVNTVGFSISALLAEGLLKISENSLRSYERVPADEYQKILHSYIVPETPPEKKPTDGKKPKIEKKS